MSTLGLTATVTSLMAAGLVAAVLLSRRRRRAVRATGPRTVGDLVRLRADEATPPVGAASVDSAPVEAAPVESAPVEAAPVQAGAVESDAEPGDAGVPDAVAPTTAGADVAAPDPAVAEAAETVPVATEVGADTRPRTLRLVPPVSEEPLSTDAASDVPVADAPVAAEPVAAEPVAEVAAEPVVVVPAQRAPVAEPIREHRAPAIPVPAAGGTDVNLRRTFGLLGPAADGEPAITLSGAVNADRPPDDDETGPAQSVRFRVARRDGTTVAGAAVSLLDDHGREAGNGYADVQGCGEILTPHPGRYLLIGTAPGHQPGAAVLSTVDGPVEAEMLLVRSAALSGSVRGTRGPISGATLTLMQDGEVIDATQSGLVGTYRFQELDAGGYGLSVAAEGWEPIAVLLDIEGGADAHRDVELTWASRSTSDAPPAQQQTTVDRKVVGGH